MFGAGADIFAVWAFVIAHAIDSSVELNPPHLAAAIGIDRSRVEQAIEFLCRPDPQSRNPAEEGRRLVWESGFQYRVVTHEYYRNMRNEDERRLYNRQKQQEHRAKNKTQLNLSNLSLTVNDLSTCQPIQKQDTDTEAKTVKDSSEPREWALGLVQKMFQFYCGAVERNPNRYTLTEKRRDKALSRIRERYKVHGGNREKV